MTAKKRERIPQGVRFDVFRRDNFTCVYCGAKSPDVTLECDHRVAVANGGNDELSNLVTACWDCNRGKGTKSLSSFRRPASRAPANDNGLVGLFGHSKDEEGAICWQFEIISMLGADACAIQLYSWIDGSASDVKVVTLSDIANADKFALYGSRDAWIGAWKKQRGYR